MQTSTTVGDVIIVSWSSIRIR